METAGYLIDSMHRLVSELCKKKKDGVDVTACQQHLENLLDFCLKSLAAFASYRLQRKEEPEDITQLKEQCLETVKLLSELAEADDDSKLGKYFASKLQQTFSPFKKMATQARQWFQEELERQAIRDKEEDEWREVTRKEDEEATVKRREQNRKDAEAQQKMGEAMLKFEEKKALKAEA